MAWLETKGDVYRIRSRYGGTKRLCALQTADRTERTRRSPASRPTCG